MGIEELRDLGIGGMKEGDCGLRILDFGIKRNVKNTSATLR
jgi:hypothetical protein